jgi:acetamidase/formamidase
MNRIASLAIIGALLGAIAPASAQQTHELKLTPNAVHWGYYDASVPPVLRIASGDTVRVETMAASGIARHIEAGASEAEIPDFLKEVEKAVTERGPGGHPLTGPIYVEGAQPGDVLEVRILRYEFLQNLGRVSFSAGGGTLPNEFPYDRIRLVRFDPAKGTAEFSPGVVLPLAPFFGSIGVAPARGRISSSPPGPHTGNLDNKELVAGSILYLPVHVPGALLSMGDGHALQGDGEVTGTALETSLAATIQVSVRKGKRLRWPRAETPTHFISMGLSPDLDEAARLATSEMIDFLVSEKGMTRDDAYLLCSLAADLRVTQLVDGTKGIHAMLPKSIFR